MRSPDPVLDPVLTVAELSSFLDEVFPQVRGQMIVEAVGPMTARLRMPIDERHLRPGDTVSGPSMFTLADCAFYAATLAMIGREALTVTTSLTINFLSKPPAADLVCEARILKLGRLLSVGECTLWSDGRDDGPVAHASVTYAIPPQKTG
jgi:uncharacterized protein (TIGR00369 family)